MGKVLLLGVTLAVLQQWCGINVIFNYAQEIFAAAGYQVSDILFNIVDHRRGQLIFTLVALFTIDRFGRRVLLLTGVAGLAIIYTMLGVFYRIAHSGQANAGAGACRYRLLCHVAGAGHMGGDLGDLSQPRSEAAPCRSR